VNSNSFSVVAPVEKKIRRVSMYKKLVDPSNPSSHPELRRVYRSIREKINGPTWVKHPTNVQIDLHNYCNLWMQGKGCIHCNVKPSGGWNLPRGAMPYDMMKYIIEYWGCHGCKSVAPYINTEPLLQEPLLSLDRPYTLRDVCDLTQKAGMHVELDTNGTLYKNRKYLVHPAMKQVRFTFSATNKETYEIVHGAPLYEEALATIQWFLKNKLETQYPMVYFITNKHNKDELQQFIKTWKGKAHLTLFPLHEVDNIQLKSVETKPEDLTYWDKLTKKIVGEIPYQKNRPIDIFSNGKTEVRYFSNTHPCQGSHSFSVAWTGQLLHCTDIPYSFNYGHVYDRDMLEVWHQRNKAKIGHSACSVCNVRHPDHDKILRKCLKV
jgi:hypothetical protein